MLKEINDNLSLFASASNKVAGGFFITSKTGARLMYTDAFFGC